MSRYKCISDGSQISAGCGGKFENSIVYDLKAFPDSQI